MRGIMMNKITIHSFITEHGSHVEYARVWRWRGKQLIGMSLLKRRLIQEKF